MSSNTIIKYRRKQKLFVLRFSVFYGGNGTFKVSFAVIAMAEMK